MIVKKNLCQMTWISFITSCLLFSEPLFHVSKNIFACLFSVNNVIGLHVMNKSV